MKFCAQVPRTCQWRGGRGGGGGGQGARDNFLGALKSKGGAKIRNCQCEISYKIL